MQRTASRAFSLAVDEAGKLAGHELADRIAHRLIRMCDDDWRGSRIDEPSGLRRRRLG